MISGSKWILVTLKVAKQVVIGFPLQMGMSLEDLARRMAAETLFTTFGALVYKSKFSVFESILPIFINSTKQLSYRSYKNLTNFQRMKIAKKKNSISKDQYNQERREWIKLCNKPEVGYNRRYDDQWRLLSRFQVVAAVTTCRQWKKSVPVSLISSTLRTIRHSLHDPSLQICIRD